MLPTTTPTSSLIFGNGKYGGGIDGNNNVIPSVSTCSPSSRDPCNGGQCVLVSGAIYTCRCRDGFTGAYCENSWVDDDDEQELTHETIAALSRRFRYQRMCFQSLVMIAHLRSPSVLDVYLVWVVAPVTIWSMHMLASVPIESSVHNAIQQAAYQRLQRAHLFWWAPANVRVVPTR